MVFYFNREGVTLNKVLYPKRTLAYGLVFMKRMILQFYKDKNFKVTVEELE